MASAGTAEWRVHLGGTVHAPIPAARPAQGGPSVDERVQFVLGQPEIDPDAVART